MVPQARIDDLPIRFGAVTLDLEAAQEVILCSGDLRQAVKASSAIPGILPPVRLNGRLLIDGGWIDKVPVLPAFRLGADVVIAVDITAGLQDASSYQRGVDVMVRANAIKDTRLVAFHRRLADVIIEPEIKHVHWADFGAFQRCIEAGEAAASAAIPAIRQLLRHERLWSVVRPGTGRRLAEIHLESSELCVE
jgi:NTE family protein